MSNVSPSTWFSGKSAPEDQKPGIDPFLFVAAVFLLYSPIGFAVVLVAFFAFNNYRVSVRVIAGFAALYCVPYFLWVAAFSSPDAMFAGYNKPFHDLIDAFHNGGVGDYLGSHVGYWLRMQLPFGIALGGMVGTAWVGWKWIRRPAWEDDTRIPGPVQRWRLRAITRDIESDADGPTNGVTIGVTKYGNKIVQTEQEAAAHTLIAGGSGSGKTTTMLIGIRDLIRRGEPVLVVDMKDAEDLPKQLAEWCSRYGRRFMHWSMTDWRLGYQGPADGPAFYDPIGRGDPSRKKDLLIGSEKWDVEYYKGINEAYLQLGFQIAELVPDPTVDSFTDVANILDWDKLRARAAQLYLNTAKTEDGNQHAAANGLNSRWFERYDDVLDPYVRSVLANAAQTIVKLEESERSAIKNMASRVQKLRTSTAGAWLRRDVEHGRDIDLRKAAEEGWVILFSVDSSTYKEVSKQVGGMIIQDLTTFSKELRSNPVTYPFHLYIDEFSSIGSDNVIDILARARDARMPTMLSTQALADLKKVDEAFLDQVKGIVNSFIIHRANAEDDAEVFAGLSGKQKTIRRMYGVEMTSGLPGGMGQGAGTGHGNIFEEEDYVARVADIQALNPGELVYISKSPKNRVVHPVKVIREDSNRAAIALTERVSGNSHGFLARVRGMPFGNAIVRLLKGIHEEPVPTAPKPTLITEEVEVRPPVDTNFVPETIPLPNAQGIDLLPSLPQVPDQAAPVMQGQAQSVMPVVQPVSFPSADADPTRDDEQVIEARIRPAENPLFPGRRPQNPTAFEAPGVPEIGMPGTATPSPATIPVPMSPVSPVGEEAGAPVFDHSSGAPSSRMGASSAFDDAQVPAPTLPKTAADLTKVPSKDMPVIDPSAFVGDAAFDASFDTPIPAMPPVAAPTRVFEEAPAVPAPAVPLPPVRPASLPAAPGLPGSVQQSPVPLVPPVLVSTPEEDPNAWDYHEPAADNAESVFGGGDVEWESDNAGWEEFGSVPGLPVHRNPNE